MYDSQKFTLEEYKAALAQPIEYPDPTNPEDPLYYKKHAHTMPPLEAYFILPPGYDRACSKEKMNHRISFYGWNNLSDFEVDSMEKTKDVLFKKRAYPQGFNDRELLKFVQAAYFNVDKAVEKLVAHFDWLESIAPEKLLTPITLRLL